MEEGHKTVSFHTLGCRLNFSETGTIVQGFKSRGYKIVDFGNQSDVTFINTCTVTDGADSSCRNLIRKAHRASPDGKIVVAGCYAQMEAEKIKQMQGVDLILGTSEKYKVFQYLDEDEDQIVKVDQNQEFFEASTSTDDHHTRAFLKIQDGCNYICSFCIIPFARGRSRALPIEDVINEAKKLLNRGHQEIVLTGVNIGEYESSTGQKLYKLVDQLLALSDLKRLRLSSVEPNTFDDDLIKVMRSSEKFMDHFHIPLQSGSDEILKLMRRKYTVSYYKDLIWKLEEYFPNAGFGADMIVGFPGETDEQFYETFELAKTLPLTHFHVFPYSKRKNTTASKMDNHIQHDLKKDRVLMLSGLGQSKLDDFCLGKIGEVSQVLFEQKDVEGFWNGYTTHFLKVRVQGHFDLNNQIRGVQLDSSDSGVLYGTLIK